MTGRLRQLGLLAGPVAAVIVYVSLPASYLSPEGAVVSLLPEAKAAAAIGVWMAVWWLTEAIPVYATALLPLLAFPLTGTASVGDAAAAYGHPLIFLFLGGFVLALALERWGVHRRLALAVLARVGTRPAHVIGAFMAIAAAISMWVTNTATTIMLLPVAISVLRVATDAQTTASGDQNRGFQPGLLLGIAYAASIGGIGTIVGTAPNLFLVSFAESQMGVQISFSRWMMIGVPLVVIFVPLCWWLLVRVLFPVARMPLPGVKDALHQMRSAQVAPSQGERLTIIVFVVTAAAWMLRPLINELSIGGIRPLAGLTDPGIAIASALALFVLPADWRKGRFLMDWDTAVRLPWGLLILFGGGLSLAAAIDQSGFSAYLGSQTGLLSALPVPLIVLLVAGMMIFLTELTSNTATTATLIPILYSVAVGLELDPFLLILPAGIAASCAFMLPVATPPNAIVFGSGQVSIAQMSRAGLWLNIVGILLVTGLTYAIALPILGVN